MIGGAPGANNIGGTSNMDKTKPEDLSGKQEQKKEWWEIDPELLNFDDKKEIYPRIKEYIKNNKEIAKKLKDIKDKDYKLARSEILKLAAENKGEGDIRDVVKMMDEVVGYYSNLEDMISELKKAGRSAEAEQIKNELQ